MNQGMCSECAFRQSCATWHEPRNRLVSAICAAGPLPFYCHTNLDWQNPLIHIMPAKVLARSFGLRICGGWQREVAARRWPEDPALRWYQRLLAKQALITAEEFLDGRATRRELQLNLTPLAEFYRGPRAWQVERMLQR